MGTKKLEILSGDYRISIKVEGPNPDKMFDRLMVEQIISRLNDCRSISNDQEYAKNPSLRGKALKKVGTNIKQIFELYPEIGKAYIEIVTIAKQEYNNLERKKKLLIFGYSESQIEKISTDVRKIAENYENGLATKKIVEYLIDLDKGLDI